MVLLPVLTPLTKPVLLTAATAEFDDIQLVISVRFWVLPSLYIPVAVNCSVLPSGIAGSLGLTAIDTKL
jgi:hypothetical protein